MEVVYLYDVENECGFMFGSFYILFLLLNDIVLLVMVEDGDKFNF